MPKKTHVKKTTETALQHQQPPPVGGGEGGGGGLPLHRRKKKAHRGQLRFPCLPAITAIKHRMVLEAFATVFEQFPLKIAELATLKGSGQYVMHRTDVYTDPSAFLGPVPPSLKAILKQQQKEEESKSKGENSGTCPVSAVCCNWNRQVPLFVTYDGYIEANNHLLEVASKLESYCDFYVSWFVQWANAVKLMKPEAQEEKALETDVQEAVMATLEDIYGSISNFADFSIDVAIGRFGAIVKMQQNPHIEDYRHDFAIFERTMWYSLVFIVRKLHAYYTRTYDVIAKNVDKLL